MRCLKIIAEHCREAGIEMDVAGSIRPVRTKRSRPNTIKDRAMKMFAEGAPVEKVAQETGYGFRFEELGPAIESCLGRGTGSPKS